MRVRYLRKKEAALVGIGRFPSFHASGSVTGMRRLFYGKGALLVRSGSFIYNVGGDPSVYYMAH